MAASPSLPTGFMKRSRRPSSRGGLRLHCAGFLVLSRLWAACEELSPKISELTDAELATLKEQSVIQMIVQRPALAVAVCRQLGWIVIPVRDSDDHQEKEGA